MSRWSRKEEIVDLIRVERWIEVDKINGFIGDLITQDI